jgi:signal transduction histidine kinase
VAHDLKDPLAVVIGSAESLEQVYDSIPNEELRQWLQRIASTGRKMSHIIDELLLLAGARTEEVKMEPLDVASIVAEVQQRLIHLIEEHQAEILLPDTWPAALGYGPWMEEVWANYISNAIKYGGRPPRIELGATVQSDGQVCFWVRDNGPGLAPEEQSRLFAPLTRTDMHEGHGLGLSIVRRIVQRLGGKVRVESELGRGSVFAFTLPGVSGVAAGSDST